MKFGKEKMNEHDLGAGEIALTQDLFRKVLEKAVADQPDPEEIDAIVQGFANCCDEDRTLDVSDIATIMDAIHSAFGGEETPDVSGEDVDVDVDVDAGGDDLDDEFEVDGDGEVATDDDGEEHEGKTRLMDQKHDADCDCDDKDDLTESKKSSLKVAEVLNEAWFKPIPGIGLRYADDEVNPEDDSEEATIRRIRQRAGLKG